MIGIYLIIHRESGRSYVGSSIAIERRFEEHRKALHLGKHHNAFLQRAWSKYGPDAFEFKIIEECGAEMLREREQANADLRRPNIFNPGHYLDCPWRGAKRDAEFCRQMSLRQKGRRHPYTSEQRRKIVAANVARTGSQHTAETKAKMSAAKKGKPKPVMSVATRAKISAAAKVRTYSPETRLKMSESARRRGYNGVERKLAHADAAEIRDLRYCGFKLRELAELFKVSIATVHCIITNRTWKEAAA